MGWSPRGERCYSSKKSIRKKRYNVIAALNQNKLFAPFLFEGYSNTEIYEVYIEKVLLPTLKPGKTLVIDNASFHKSKKIIDLIESVDCNVIFLPPYSPDLNPIEHLWTSLKHSIRKLASEAKDFFNAAVSGIQNVCRSNGV